MAKKLTTEDFIQKAKKVHGDRYDYSLVEYKNSRTKVTIICRKHGEFKQTPEAHCGGSNCQICSIEKRTNMLRLTTEEFIRKAKKVHGDKYDYSLVDYKCTRTKIKIICPNHGEFEQAPNNHLNGQGCLRCGNLRKTNTIEEFIDKSKEVHGDKYDYSLVDYHNNYTKATLICKAHGTFAQIPNSHMLGKGCPSCAKSGGISSQEREIFDLLTSLNVYAEQSNREILGGKELDIFIPEHNLAIEFNGLYWHGDRFVDKNAHQEKAIACMRQGIQLIHVWEDDWNNPIKKGILIRKIKFMLGLEEQRAYARKCDVDDNISIDEAKDFLIKNHIQGYVPSRYSGLRYNGELVAVLGMKRTKDEGIYDLVRFATSKSVVGGFSKLLSHWKKHNEWKKIITYAHLDYSHGNLYKVNGFEEEHITLPNYWYFMNKGSRESRQKFMKHKLKDKLSIFDPLLTEKENVEANGFMRIYDAGSIRFSLENKKEGGG